MEKVCTILDGKNVANKFKENLKNRIEIIVKNNPNIRYPKLTIYSDFSDNASEVYMRNKKKT